MDYRPWTWKVPENSTEMSRTINRQDAFERVSGQAAAVSRRNFLKEGGSAFGGAALAGVTPSAAAAEEAKMTLLDPTGAQEITHLFAPRLPDLNGRLIAELAVDPTKWQPHRTMPYIEELLKKQFPTIKFVPMQEFPMGIQVSEDRVIQFVAARKPDAVIIGNAG